MKSCRKQQMRPRQSSGREAGQSVPVHRYVHPIQTAASGRRSTEELLTEVLDVLSRQEQALAELLRRTGSEGYNTDTK